MFFSITLSSGRCILLIIHLWVKKTSQYEGAIKRLDLLPWLPYKWRARDLLVHYLQRQLSQLLISPVIRGNLNYVSDTWSVWLGLVSVDRDGKWIQFSNCISGRMQSYVNSYLKIITGENAWVPPIVKTMLLFSTIVKCKNGKGLECWRYRAVVRNLPNAETLLSWWPKT